MQPDSDWAERVLGVEYELHMYSQGEFDLN
jgi:hypothetical protein